MTNLIASSVIDEDQKTIRGVVFLRRGAEFTSTAILKWAGDTGVGWHYIDPGQSSGKQPPGLFSDPLIRSRTLGQSLGPVAFAASMIESFNGSLRDECLNEDIFDSLADARQKLALWRYDYNNTGRIPRWVP